jgi:hypothetical protein
MKRTFYYRNDQIHVMYHKEPDRILNAYRTFKKQISSPKNDVNEFSFGYVV